MQEQQLSLVGVKIKKMIDDGIIDNKILKDHIRLNRLSRVISKEEENYLDELLGKRN